MFIQEYWINGLLKVVKIRFDYEEGRREGERKEEEERVIRIDVVLQFAIK